MDWLKGHKTYIVSGLLVVVGIIQVISGDMTFQQFLASPACQEILTGLGLGALRAGVAKVE